jgi:hypothetical protein
MGRKINETMNRIFITAAVLALGITGVKATIYTEYVDIAPAPQGVGGQLVFNIPQFDLSGTVNSVSLTLTPVVGDIGYSVYNGAASPESITFASVSNPNGSLTDGNSLGFGATWSSSQSLEAQNFTAAPAGFTTGSLPFNAFTIASSTVTVGPAGFVGGGSYALTINGSAVANSSGTPTAPSTFYGWYGNVGGDLEVDFNVTLVPEPSSWALMAMGGFLFVRRLLNKQSLAR